MVADEVSKFIRRRNAVAILVDLVEEICVVRPFITASEQESDKVAI